jgi:CBS domain-containing protein
MTRGAQTARSSEPLEDALRRMRSRGIRRLPVVDADGQLEGIVTFDDILKAMSFELSGLIGLMARERQREQVTRP